MPRVCFCADDFAMNIQIDQAIFQLIERGSLQATSCMTQSPFWENDALKLKQYSATIDIGLHFNLTHVFDAQTLSYPLAQLMLRAWSHQLDKRLIRKSIQQQWDYFIEVIGQQPHFVDGHQHVHQFPIIREVLIDFLKEQQFKGWVRSLNQTVHLAPYQFKSQLLQMLGARRLTRLCQEANFAQNEQFAGIYDFSMTHYPNLCQQWFSHAEHQLLIMCHPSIEYSDTSDSIYKARIQEYNYLISEQFFHDCKKNNIKLGRIGTHDV